jgi:hypothetical protein
MVPVAKTVQAVAGDAVGEDDRVASLWDKLDTDTQRSVAGVLAKRREVMSASEISEEIGPDGTDSPGSNIRYLRGQVDIQPYFSTDDGYSLSLAGRYVWREYGPDLPEAEAPKAADDEADSGEDGAETVEESSKDPDGGSEEGSEEVDLSTFEVRE